MFQVPHLVVPALLQWSQSHLWPPVHLVSLSDLYSLKLDNRKTHVHAQKFSKFYLLLSSSASLTHQRYIYKKRLPLS